ncbi:hypothetical protein D3C71_1261220 [compost metagenome]
MEVQPQASAFHHHLASVGFAGNVHPGACVVLFPVAVGFQGRVYVQAEVLSCLACAQLYGEADQAYGHLHAFWQVVRCVFLLQAGDAGVAGVSTDFAVQAAGHQRGEGGRGAAGVALACGTEHEADGGDSCLFAVFDAISVAVALHGRGAAGAGNAGGLVFYRAGDAVVVRHPGRRRGHGRGYRRFWVGSDWQGAQQQFACRRIACNIASEIGNCSHHLVALVQRQCQRAAGRHRRRQIQAPGAGHRHDVVGGAANRDSHGFTGCQGGDARQHRRQG